MVVQLHLTRIVEELEHELVGTAMDMHEALEVARAERPELVLMDIHLASGTDGVETGFFEIDTGSAETWTVQLTEPGDRDIGGR